MALHQHRGGATALPLRAMLATIPSLPRPILARLVARMIERLDEQDGDPDLEDDDADTSITDEPHDGDDERLGYAWGEYAIDQCKARYSDVVGHVRLIRVGDQ